MVSDGSLRAVLSAALMGRVSTVEVAGTMSSVEQLDSHSRSSLLRKLCEWDQHIQCFQPSCPPSLAYRCLIPKTVNTRKVLAA